MTPQPFEPDVIVVGAGLAGLVATHELALAGKRVLIREDLNVPIERDAAGHARITSEQRILAALPTIRAARDAGAAVLLISDDLDEVMTLGDRIAVMHHGRLTEARRADEWTREGIGLAMAGAA